MTSNTSSSVSEFVLQCEIKPEQRSFAVSILTLIYFVTLFGNLLVTLIIRMNRHLQTPMYIYIGTLAVVDLLNSTNIIPKMVAVLLDSVTISYGPCLLQMYLMIYLGIVESLLFVCMACDRYTAVLHPLRYSSLITNKIVWLSLTLSNVISVVGLTPVMVFITELVFCKSNVLPYCFCDYITIIHVSCTQNPKYFTVLAASASLFGYFPLAIILFSYLRIAQAALNISSVDGRSKVLSTCLTHLLVMSLFYLPLIIPYILTGSGVNLLSREAYNIMVVISTVVPPMMNPIIYSFRNREIKSTIYKTVNGVLAFFTSSSR
uniref:G-protein coupled receptors family 1 profile domain-containing protein n=1 Tax=Erpetoichthys calabaricus TaxID=27687 RepID=A0A8C4SWC8_ERPCA